MQHRPVRRLRPKLAALITSAALALGILAGPLALLPAHADGTNKMMLVLDSSGSMKEKLGDGKTKISAARSALDSVIDHLPSTQQVGLRVYGATVFNHSDKGACTDSQRAVDLATDNRSQLKAAVKKYKPYGETPTGYALKQAGKDLGSGGRRTIVLVSDGEPTCAPNPCTVAADLADQGIDLTIDVVGLDVSGKARTMLKCIADKANGHYYDADSADDIDNALDTVATRSRRPYQPTGKKVTGSEQATGAPAITSGDWLDRIGGLGRKRSDLFYTIRRKVPGSTVHVSASLTAQHERDGMRLKIVGDNNTECGTAYDVHDDETGPIVSVAVDAPGYRASEKDCTDNDTFTVEVIRALDRNESTVPLEIRVSEEPPVADAKALPKHLAAPSFTRPRTTTAHKIVGGSSFADATKIKPGSYSGNIVPGEVQIFSVPVDWGQHLSAEARVDPISKKLNKAMGLTNIWLLNDVIYTPARAEAENSDKSDAMENISQDGADCKVVSYPVVYRNRSSDDLELPANNRAGNYYIAVSLNKLKSKSFQLPFTLNVGVDGTVQGKPSYVKNGSTSSASATPTASTTPSASTDATAGTAPSSTESAAGPTTTPSGNVSGNTVTHTLGIGAAVLGGLAVIGGAIALVRTLRRRS